MDEDVVDPANPIDGTNPFGIRHMFALTGIAAVICGCMGVFIRQLPDEKRTTGAMFLILSLIFIGAVIAVSGIRRARIERKAGRRHYVSRDGITSWNHVFGIVACLGLIGFLIAIMYFSLNANGNIPWHTVWNLFYLSWLLGAFACKYLMSVLYWKTDSNSVEVRENGMVQGFYTFLPWTMLKSYKWNQFTQKLMLYIDGSYLEYNVPLQSRSELENAIKKFIPKHGEKGA